jgi:hypothetical protein
MEEQIKNCPFCEAEASMNGPYYKGTALDDFKNFASGLQESTFYFRVACNGCDIGTIKYEEKEMAIKDWNKRINQNKTTINQKHYEIPSQYLPRNSLYHQPRRRS